MHGLIFLKLKLTELQVEVDRCPCSEGDLDAMLLVINWPKQVPNEWAYKKSVATQILHLNTMALCCILHSKAVEYTFFSRLWKMF